jgi:cell division protein FtsL
MRRRRPRRSLATPGMLVLGFSGLLSALSYVTWRQSRAFEALAELDGIERSLSLAESERAELVRRIQGLDNRPRISAFAQEHLGMHRPEASEMRLLPGGTQ